MRRKPESARTLDTRSGQRSAAGKARKEGSENVGGSVGKQLLCGVDLVFVLLGEEVGEREVDGVGDDGGEE